jgi:hypothetical protein
MGDKIIKNEMGGACSTYGDSRIIYRILVGKPEDPDQGVDGKIILEDWM